MENHQQIGDSHEVMVDPQRLLDRLDAIGRRLEARGDALGLIGLGSVGRELERLDAFSDLDFFVIVEPGAKGGYLQSLDWLADEPEVLFSFQNTRDGHKALLEGGVFCEFAVFERSELAEIPFAPGRIVWQRADASRSWAEPERALPSPPSDVNWLMGEALSCLYVGLLRDARGERLAAQQMIQGHAVDHLLALIDLARPSESPARDPFNVSRRFEARHPESVSNLAEWMPGYGQNRSAALAMLVFLESHFETCESMAAAIRRAATY